MASLRIPTLRHVITNSAPYLRASQRRWAQVHDVRFLATHQQERVLEKYKEKLERAAKEKGFKDSAEIRAFYQQKQVKLQQAARIALETGKQPDIPIVADSSPYPPPPPAPEAATITPAEKKSSSPGIKTLSSFLDVPKTLELPPKEIEAIWRLRHVADPQSLCAAIPLNVYKTIESTAKKHPHFILPLPKEGQGAEIHFLQWTFPAENTVTVLFTHLAEYKLRGEFSEPHTTITHHLELAGPKELVLLQGQVVEGRGVSVDEAKWLIMCLQKFYGPTGEKGERRRLLELFAKGDSSFKLEELVEEAEKIV